MEVLLLCYPVYAAKEDREAMENNGIANCVECGYCDYISPSHITIVKPVKKCKKETAEVQNLYIGHEIPESNSNQWL